MKNDFKIRGDITEIYFKVKGHKMKTLINTADLERVSQFGTWFGKVDNKSTKVYVYSYMKDKEGNRKQVGLHRVILGIENEPEFVTDHKNYNTLDNRRENLRAMSNKKNIRDNNKRKPIVRKLKNGRWGLYDGETGTLLDSFRTKRGAEFWSIAYSLAFYPELTEYNLYENKLDDIMKQ